MVELAYMHLHTVHSGFYELSRDRPKKFIRTGVHINRPSLFMNFLAGPLKVHKNRSKLYFTVIRYQSHYEIKFSPWNQIKTSNDKQYAIKGIKKCTCNLFRIFSVFHIEKRFYEKFIKTGVNNINKHSRGQEKKFIRAGVHKNRSS